MKTGEFRRLWTSHSLASKESAAASRSRLESRPLEGEIAIESKIVRLQRPWFGAFPTGNGPQAA